MGNEVGNLNRIKCNGIFELLSKAFKIGQTKMKLLCFFSPFILVLLARIQPPNIKIFDTFELWKPTTSDFIK